MSEAAQKVVRAYGNFSSGQIDHDLMGRFDLPTYSNGADVFQNFISNFKGNAIFAPGFINEVAFQDCAFVEFKFGITQNYICAFYNGSVQFLAFDTNGNFGWVLSGGVPLVVSSPYTLADAQFISQRGSYAQNDDVMYICHRNYAPYKLTRTAANAFTLATYVRISDPFCSPSLSVSDTSTTSIAIPTTFPTSETFTVSSGKTYTVAQQIKFVDSTGLNTMTGTVTSYSGTSLVVSITGATGSGTIASWTITMTATGWPGACCFYGGSLYMASTSNFLTNVWFSNKGSYDDFTIQNPITDASGFSFTCANITQQIEWLFPADYSLIAGATDGILVINGGAINTAVTPSTVQALITSAQPCNGAYPLKKDALVFYQGQISRNIFTIRYDILMQTFSSQDCNLESYDMTRGLLTKMRYKRDRNDLIYSMRADGNLVSTVFKQEEHINGWHLRNTQGAISDIALIGDNLGNPQLFALVERNGTYYIEMQAPLVEFKKPADFWTQYPEDPQNNPNEDMDTEAYIRYVSEQSRQCNYLDNSMYYSDYRTSTITFTQTGTDSSSGAPTGHIISGASDFSSSKVGQHIVYKTATGYESGRFLITGYVSATEVLVTAIQIPHGINDTPLNVWSSWYMTFTSVSGLSQYNGQSVGLVLDGGFDSAQTITGGVVALDEPTASICIGYLYTGIIKSMCIGFQLQGSNTQITQKEIDRISLRCVNSLGLKVGSSLYDLQEVQLRGPSDINYLPPAPIDGTIDIDVDSDSAEDFYWYAVQDLPLPACIANYFLEANYALTT